MKADLLIRGAELLEADAAKSDGVRFDLGTWAAPYDAADPKKTIFDDKVENIPVDCNTRACAMGLFCLSGAFKNEGLEYAFSDSYRTLGFDLHPELDGRHGYYAAMRLFDIPYSEAERLFSPDEYDDTKGAEAELAVAKRMRALAAGENIFDYKYHDEDEDEDED